MGKKDKKSSRQAYSKDTSENFINDGKTTRKRYEKLLDIREILNDTNQLKEKQPCCFWTCGCLSVIIVVSLIIIIPYLVKCDAKETYCNATISNNTHHISNCAEYSKVHEYNTLHPEPFCQFPFPRSQVSFMKCFLPLKGEYTLDCVFHKVKEVKRICSVNDTDYHFKLDCAGTDENCSPACFENCTHYSITIPTPSILLLEISDTCLEEDGHIAIWNATIHKMG